VSGGNQILCFPYAKPVTPGAFIGPDANAITHEIHIYYFNYLPELYNKTFSRVGIRHISSYLSYSPHSFILSGSVKSPLEFLKVYHTYRSLDKFDSLEISVSILEPRISYFFKFLVLRWKFLHKGLAHFFCIFSYLVIWVTIVNELFFSSLSSFFSSLL